MLTTGFDVPDVDCVIMDTGIVVGHPEFNDLGSNSSSRINQINWGGTQGGSFYTDPSGHGTHVAGTIGAVGNNGVGVAGELMRT